MDYKNNIQDHYQLKRNNSGLGRKLWNTGVSALTGLAILVNSAGCSIDKIGPYSLRGNSLPGRSYNSGSEDKDKEPLYVPPSDLPQSDPLGLTPEEPKSEKTEDEGLPTWAWVLIGVGGAVVVGAGVYAGIELSKGGGGGHKQQFPVSTFGGGENNGGSGGN